MHVHSGGDGDRDELLTVDEKMAKSLFNQVFCARDIDHVNEARLKSDSAFNLENQDTSKNLKFSG